MAHQNLPERPLQLPPLPLKGLDVVTRAAALTQLATFAESFYPGWVAGAFHEMLAHKLEDCLRRKVKRLIISVPPQHGKSRLASINFPAWALTKYPTLRIFQAGHTSDLSTGFSREARTLVSSDAYLQLFPPIINTRVNRGDYWQTKLGGYYYSTSVGGGTGMPADILLIDDPHRDRAEANSQLQRDKVWDWFTSTAMTRLAPDAVLIVIQTRWHRDDLAGRLQDPRRIRALQQAGFGDMVFDVISLEALCENPASDIMGRKMGEALWPERRDARWLAAQKLQITSPEWNALYQQRPNPPGGSEVDIRNIKIIKRSDVPPNVDLNRGWDLALSDRNAGDYSAGARGGVDKDGNLYLVHMDRGKRLWPAQRAVVFSYIEREAIGKRVGVEAVGAWELALNEIREKFAGRVMVRSFVPTTDKATRAIPWMCKIDSHKFFMVEGEWNQDFLDELEQFPNGQHDDQVDAVTVMHELFCKRDNFVWS